MSDTTRSDTGLSVDAAGKDNSRLARLEATVVTDPVHAAAELRNLLKSDPLDAGAYRLLARALAEHRRDEADDGGVRTIVRSADSLLWRASHALERGDLETAEVVLRRRLLERPGDVNALYWMARLAELLDFERESESLLGLALELAPDFSTARIALAKLFDKQHRPLDACRELDFLLEREPGNVAAKALKAATLSRAGDYGGSIELYEEMLVACADEPELWTTYGYNLTTVGRAREGEAAMRQATKLSPHSGGAWWNLSNIKTARLNADDITTMLAALRRADLGDPDRSLLHFALGKAFEDSGDARRAFEHYERANEVRQKSTDYRPEHLTADVDATIRLFTRNFFDHRTGWGLPDRSPIFVLGMPRAGSTLIEQILASHSEIEGTKELPEIPLIAKELGRGRGSYYPTMETIGPDRINGLASRYLERASIHRKAARPFFVDKMPNNWLHLPLIHTLLPNAKIIDARRHPLACGFSNFKQYYVEGHAFSYDLKSIGHYYSEYVRLMTHFDNVLPGRVYRVVHELLVEDAESEIRRMLDHLEVPFDPACLSFHETKRAVRTPSSEQVRRPISRDGVDQWLSFEPWLGPLKESLGPVLDSYPGPPSNEISRK